MKSIISGIVVFTVGLLSPQIIQAQGTLTYLSNLGQASTGSDAVGSDSWLAAGFHTGNNASGYTLDSIQLGMTDASGNPSGFTATIYSSIVNIIIGTVTVGSSLGTLNGSTDPATGGVFTYNPASNLMLSSGTYYYIVLTAGTTVANGAYEWNNANSNSYNPSGGWSQAGGVWTSSDGLSWHPQATIFPQFAINATAIPEPGVLSLLGLGGLGFLWHRRKLR